MLTKQITVAKSFYIYIYIYIYIINKTRFLLQYQSKVSVTDWNGILRMPNFFIPDMHSSKFASNNSLDVKIHTS